MRLNNESLRNILVAIFDVDEKYIVPKQGNWYNPADNDDKPNNWIAYLILESGTITLPDYQDDSKAIVVNKVSSNVPFEGIMVDKISDIDLQFVGKDAEDLAHDVSFWINRATVQKQFETVNGKLMAGRPLVRTSPFIQGGLNNVLSYNVRIRVAWIDFVETNQTAVHSAELGGIINV